MKQIRLVIFLTVLLSVVSAVRAQPLQPPATAMPDKSQPIETVTIHPLFATDYACSEHWEGQLAYPGDSLGADCIVQGGLPTDGKSGFAKLYKTDGLTNEDWYGWGETVLAPFEAVVEKVHINPIVNKPGQLGKPPASFVIFKHEDGTRVLIGHVADVTVKEGENVKAGQPFAKVGNNGFGRAPHIHVGAWRPKVPLQIRFDLRTAGEMRKKK